MTPRAVPAGWWLCAPAVAVMLAVTAWPIADAFWLSLQRHDLRFPDQRAFVGFANYAAVLGSSVWWEAFAVTSGITAVSAVIELALGLAFALVMHRAVFARGPVRASILVPYGIVTVVAALGWKFAFDPATGFVNPTLGLDRAWLTARGSALFVIVVAEAWKTTPFVALLLLAGRTAVSEDLLRAARVDGASAIQQFTRITLPLMKPVILVALLFRCLDAFRIFDTVFILTRGAQGTASVSIVGYETLIARLNLGLGSAVSVLIFLGVAAIAAIFVLGLGAAPATARGDS